MEFFAITLVKLVEPLMLIVAFLVVTRFSLLTSFILVAVLGLTLQLFLPSPITLLRVSAILVAAFIQVALMKWLRSLFKRQRPTGAED
jgi:hypothetical protein